MMLTLSRTTYEQATKEVTIDDVITLLERSEHMAGRIGGKVALDGEKQFKQAVRGINDEFRVMKAELKQVSTEFTRNNKTIGDAKKENKELEKNIDQLNKRLIEQEKRLEERI